MYVYLLQISKKEPAIKLNSKLLGEMAWDIAVNHQEWYNHQRCVNLIEWYTNHSILKSHITVMSQWAPWRLQSSASVLLDLSYVQAPIKGNIKDPRHWPLSGESTGDWWILHVKTSNAENVSIWWRHHHVVVTYIFIWPICVADPAIWQLKAYAGFIVIVENNPSVKIT